MPVGARPVMFGPYRYYSYGGAYYYPYLSGGRTVYVEVDVNSPPPPANEVMIDIGVVY